MLANTRLSLLTGSAWAARAPSGATRKLATAITASVVCSGARGRYFNTVDLVTRLEEEARIGKAGAKKLIDSLVTHDILAPYDERVYARRFHAPRVLDVLLEQ